MQPTINPGLPYTNLEAVGIHIYNPTVNAGSNNAPQAPAQPQQQLPGYYYNVPQNNVYGNQNNSSAAYAAYAAPMLSQQAAPQQVPVQQQPAAAPVEVPPPQIDQVQPQAVAPQPEAAPAPQPAPEQPQAAQAPVPPQQPEAPAPAVQPAQPEQVAQAPQPAQQPQEANPSAALAQEIVTGLKGAPQQQTESIQKLADLGQNNPQQATELLKSSGPELLQGLVSVFNQKAEGADAKAIDDNKRIAMYTTAIMQKNFRDAMNGEIQKLNQQGQNVPNVGITELPAIQELVEKMRPEVESNPEVRSAAIQALNYLAQPEDTPILSELYNAVIGVPNDPQKPGDPDATVKAAAQQALAALPAAAPQAEAPQAVQAQQPAAEQAQAPAQPQQPAAA